MAIREIRTNERKCSNDADADCDAHCWLVQASNNDCEFRDRITLRTHTDTDTATHVCPFVLLMKSMNFSMHDAVIFCLLAFFSAFAKFRLSIIFSAAIYYCFLFRRCFGQSAMTAGKKLNKKTAITMININHILTRSVGDK